MTLMNLHSLPSLVWLVVFIQDSQMKRLRALQWRDSLSRVLLSALLGRVFNHPLSLVDVAVNPGVKDNAVWRGHHRALNGVRGVPRGNSDLQLQEGEGV